MDRRLTKENVIAKTLYGSDVYSHILRQFYPSDFLMRVSGDDCGWNRNPWDNSAPSLHIWMEKVDPEKSGDELLQILNDELHLHLGEEQPGGVLFQTPLIAQPHFSFFKAPVRNVTPYKQISLLDTWRYITGRYARRRTEELRLIRDPKRARMFKAEKFDYCTFSGTFSVRREDKLLNHSGLLCLDFDHLPDVEGLFRKLLQDEYFETMLLFRSPSGDGLKWIIPTDLTECSHAAFFRSVSAYVAQTYGVPVDQSGKDVCRACFLPHDPQAYLNPDYSRAL